MSVTKTQDLSEAFTKDGVTKLKTNQLLRFEYEGKMNEYIITKLNKKSGKVWARQTTTYTQDQVNTEDSLGTVNALEMEDLS